jgi:hypothetical protein
LRFKGSFERGGTLIANGDTRGTRGIGTGVGGFGTTVEIVLTRGGSGGRGATCGRSGIGGSFATTACFSCVFLAGIDAGALVGLGALDLLFAPAVLLDVSDFEDLRAEAVTGFAAVVLTERPV